MDKVKENAKAPLDDRTSAGEGRTMALTLLPKFVRNTLSC
jgi:hypothetical protein